MGWTTTDDWNRKRQEGDKKGKKGKKAGFDTDDEPVFTHREGEDGFWDKELDRISAKIERGDDLSAWEMSLAKQYGLLGGGYAE